MGFVFAPSAGLNDVRQYFLELLAIHFILSQLTCRGNPNALSLKLPVQRSCAFPGCLIALFGLGLALSPIYLSAGGLFGSAEFQQVAQLHTRLVQLRLAVTNRTTHHFRNFVMF